MDWNLSDILQMTSIIVSIILAIAIYLLQKQLSDKQKVDHRFEVEREAGKKFREIQARGYSSKIELYNVKLLNKKYFAKNKRSRIWGMPYHAAHFHAITFNGLEFAVSTEHWHGQDYIKVGLIPFERVLGIKLDGDGSFGGMIIYAKPLLLQKDKFAIAYKSFRYYPLERPDGGEVRKPARRVLIDAAKRVFFSLRYNFYLRWKFLYLNRKT